MWTKTNKTLGIILLIVTIVLVIDLTTGTGGKSSFRQQLIEADTSQIGKIVFFAKGDKDKQITLERGKDKWYVLTGEEKYPADPDKIRSILETLTDLRPTQVVANTPKQWAEYGVTDTGSLNILVYNLKNKELARLYAGKIKSSQTQGQYPYMGHNQNFYTYLRMEGDKNVYLVPHLLALTFVDDPNAYRDQTIINTDQTLIKEIAINTGKQSFLIKRDGTDWTIDGQAADSLRMEQYLRDITHMQGWQFADNDKISGLKTLKTLTLSLLGGKQITVKGLGDTAVSVIWSSQNPQTYFKAAALDSRLFKDKSHFLADDKE